MLLKTKLPGELKLYSYDFIFTYILIIINNIFITEVSSLFSLIIIAVLSLCFINSYNGKFVFDDSEAIVHNEDIQTTPLIDIFKNDFWGTKLTHKQSHKSYRPLTILSFRYFSFFFDTKKICLNIFFLLNKLFVDYIFGFVKV